MEEEVNWSQYRPGVDHIHLNWKRLGELAASGRDGFALALSFVLLWYFPGPSTGRSTYDRLKEIWEIRPFLCPNRETAREHLASIPLRFIEALFDRLLVCGIYEEYLCNDLPFRFYHWSSEGPMTEGGKARYSPGIFTQRLDMARVGVGWRVKIRGESYTLVHEVDETDRRAHGYWIKAFLPTRVIAQVMTDLKVTHVVYRTRDEKHAVQLLFYTRRVGTRGPLFLGLDPSDTYNRAEIEADPAVVKLENPVPLPLGYQPWLCPDGRVILADQDDPYSHPYREILRLPDK